MSSFNVLITEVACPDCEKRHEARIQFKFGNTWQLQYKIGDKVTWGGNDIGIPNLNEVNAYGIIESTKCPYCNKQDIVEEYDILIKNDVIMGISPMASMENYLGENGEYFVVT
ncbi:hypothetical protein [Chitinophaga filiformis]|uniref:Uncharacterized protein n=1 Tax=Chitinophaga filiformis TaxID=104663 RepID=A0A1G7LZ84_CHIFI|nr:hypothetical protein [Chitinophaga filiformis]SDF54753.1 hypothetical protein SAMN04488121_102236 [Chitinophaga filiformis]